MGYRRFIVGVAVLCVALVGIAAPASAKAAAKQVPDPNATFTDISTSTTNILLNPHTYSGGLTGWDLFTAAYDRLIGNTADDSDLAPQLATSWKWDSTNTQLTLALRKDASFHDGTPFNADVAVANLKAGTAAGSNGTTMLATMTNVEAVDPYTLRLTFNQPSPDALFALAYYPGMMVSLKGLANPSQLSGGEQGSGPFKLVSLDAALTYTFDRFDGYWNKSHVYPAHFVYRANTPDENTRLSALSTGQADFTTISATTYNQAVANKDLQVVTHPALPAYQIFMNNTKAPFTDPRVREAVSLALDHKAYVAGVDGLAKEETQPIPTNVDGNLSGYKAPKQNVAKAKQLIEQAGATGKTVKMATITFEPYPTFSKVAQAQLMAIGLDVQLDIFPSGSAFRLQYQAGADEMLFAPTTMTVNDPSQILDQYVIGIGNPGTKDPTLTAKVQQAETLAIGSKERTAAMQAINKDLMNPQYMLFVPVVHGLLAYAATNKVIGLKDNFPTSSLSQAAQVAWLQIAKSK